MLISKKSKTVIVTLAAITLTAALNAGCTFSKASSKDNKKQTDKKQVTNKLPSKSTKTETININKISVSNLSSDTNVGVGVFLDYANDNIVIFHGYFGLFVYDLKDQKMVMSIDLKKAVGTTDIQGSDTADVRVSSDGSLIQLYSTSESGNSKNAYYIKIPDLTCTYEAYHELKSYYSLDEKGHAQFNDGTYGEIDSDLKKATINTLKYKRGDKVYNLFK